MTEDWLYTDERLNLRAESLGYLLHWFGWELQPNGLPVHSMESIQNCAHDWVSQGNGTVLGIGDYFLKNYTNG